MFAHTSFNFHRLVVVRFFACPGTGSGCGAERGRADQDRISF